MNNINNRTVLEKEIDLIQNCIARMSQNSFLVKGWLITIIAVLIGLLPQIFENGSVYIVGIVLTICFWYLDAFFLKTEKMFRWKYEWVIQNRLSSDEHIYDLNPQNKEMWNLFNGTKRKEPCILIVMLNKTILPIYLIIIGLQIFVVLN